MEGWLLILFLLWVANGIYNSGYATGKRVGSRKGYGVGYSRGRRQAAPGGCLVAVVAIMVLGAAAMVVAASCR